MTISVEPMEGVSFDPVNGTSARVQGVRVEWQTVKGGKREHTNIVMDSEEPADMLAAAAAYFGSLLSASEPSEGAA